jgi:hypothetical protein
MGLMTETVKNDLKSSISMVLGKMDQLLEVVAMMATVRIFVKNIFIV